MAVQSDELVVVNDFTGLASRYFVFYKYRNLLVPYFKSLQLGQHAVHSFLTSEVDCAISVIYCGVPAR